jgi:hypothetical protein
LTGKPLISFFNPQQQIPAAAQQEDGNPKNQAKLFRQTEPLLLSNVKFINPIESNIYLEVLLIKTFANKGSAGGCKCLNRTAGLSYFTFKNGWNIINMIALQTRVRLQGIASSIGDALAAPE